MQLANPDVVRKIWQSSFELANQDQFSLNWPITQGGFSYIDRSGISGYNEFLINII